MVIKVKKIELKKLILIDGNALVHRAYHALPRFIAPDGRLVNAVYGFISILIKILKDFQPDYILATFDLAGPTFRHQIYKEYKATRVKMPDELYAQIPIIKEALKALNVAIYEKQGFEADDIIGSIVKMFDNSLKVKTFIFTGDLDTLQLVDRDTEVIALKKGISEVIIYDEKTIFERYGLKPKQLIDFKGLCGDPSDNIIGVKGIGEKTAIDLLKKFGNLENIYKNLEYKDIRLSKSIKEKLLKNKNEAFFSRRLATIKTDVDINFKLEDTSCKKLTFNKFLEFLKSLNFQTLIKRIQEFTVQQKGLNL